MWSAVFIFLVKILFGKEVLQMLVRLYAGEVILEKITIDDVPRGLRERVKAYLVEMAILTPSNQEERASPQPGTPLFFEGRK